MEGVVGRGSFHVKPLKIAKYPVTWVQYRAFLEASDGYQNRDWWKGLSYRANQPGEQFRRLDNHRVENVSWYDAIAFCRWLSARLGYVIRLPTEWEWEQASTGGNPGRTYPWGREWHSNRANTFQSGLHRTTAVGMYPQGASPVGALDMSGNVWEWCIPIATNNTFARVTHCFKAQPYDLTFNIGFRVATDDTVDPTL